MPLLKREIAKVTKLVLADVFVPEGGIFLDVIGEESRTLLRVEIDDFDVEGAEPVDAAPEIARFTDNDAGKSELANEAAAIPAGSERGDHGEFAIRALPAGVAEGVGFSVEGGIAILDAAIVAGAEERAVFIENGRADRDAAFGEAFAGFGEGDREHGAVIERSLHRGIIRGNARPKFKNGTWGTRNRRKNQKPRILIPRYGRS